MLIPGLNVGEMLLVKTGVFYSREFFTRRVDTSRVAITFTMSMFDLVSVYYNFAAFSTTSSMFPTR